jgi:cellulose synthase (UDP-forming)
MVLFGLVPGHLRRMRGILRTRFAFALAYYPITAAVLTGGQLLGPVAVLTGVPWVHVSYPAFVLHMTAVSMWLLFGILLLRRRGLMRPAEAPVFTWENALFMLTRWPYVVRGVWAGIIGVIRPRPVTFKVTPKGTGGMPGLPTKLMAPFVVFSTLLSGIAIYGELANRVIGYVFLCIVSALYYGAVSVVVPLLHMREVARSAGVRTRQAFRTARLPLTLGIATFLPLVYAAIRYYPHIVDLLSR